jgi:hypothetical protein
MKTSSSPSWVAAVGQCYDVTLLEASLAAVALIHRLHLVSAGASSIHLSSISPGAGGG